MAVEFLFCDIMMGSTGIMKWGFDERIENQTSTKQIASASLGTSEHLLEVKYH